MTGPDNRLFLFLHLAKTGGITIRNFFNRALELQKTFIHLAEPTLTEEKKQGFKPFAERPVEERSTARVILGHNVTLQTHLLVPGKVPHYLLFLREPADRLVSYYNYDMYRREKNGEGLIGFNEWYEAGKRYNIGVGWIYKEVLGGTLTRGVDDEVYCEVLEALEKLWFVGCAEFLDRDFPVIAQFIGVSATWQRANATGLNFPRHLTTDDQLRARLREENPFDFKLYEHWRDRVDNRVKEISRSIPWAMPAAH